MTTSFLAGLTGTLATTSGCVLPARVKYLDDPIADVRFEEVTPQKNRPVDTDGEGRDRDPSIVGWDDAESAIQVSGFVFYGGGCDAPVLWTVKLRADKRLFVSVGHRKEWYLRLPIPLPVSCTVSLGGIHYRMTVTFDNGVDFPGTVEVVEDNEAALDVHRVVN